MKEYAATEGWKTIFLKSARKKMYMLKKGSV